MRQGVTLLKWCNTKKLRNIFLLCRNFNGVTFVTFFTPNLEEKKLFFCFFPIISFNHCTPVADQRLQRNFFDFQKCNNVTPRSENSKRGVRVQPTNINGECLLLSKTLVRGASSVKRFSLAVHVFSVWARFLLPAPNYRSCYFPDIVQI